ncbi:MAG: sigma-70 family RNA polymerase sigma factor [Deltaproteobacteria bacterium]|jgi:RNA polymerase sigma-70 factor (ECF subfamily)
MRRAQPVPSPSPCNALAPDIDVERAERDEISGVHDLRALDRAADRASYDLEVLRHRPELIAAAIRLTGSRSEADDLVQEAVLRAWMFWHRFEPGTNGRAWMHRILLNTFINGYRKRRREREVLAQVHAVESHARHGAGLVPRTPGETLSDEVHAALERLPEDFRRVIVLVDLEDRSYRDASVAMGCPIGTVMSRLHRARRAMQRELAAYAVSHGYVAQLPAGEPSLEAA